MAMKKKQEVHRDQDQLARKRQERRKLVRNQQGHDQCKQDALQEYDAKEEEEEFE